MENTTFFVDEKYKRRGAALYDANNEPLDYRHFIYRPAGAANASARDMAKFVQFFIHRGAIDTLQLIAKTSMERMEVPGSTPGAKAGLELGFGLGNFTSIHKGFVYQGHEGAIHGSLTELAYLPEYGIGHVFFINASNGKAFSEISRLIRDFETQHLQRNVQKNEPVNEVEFERGYYVSINPRIQGALFLDHLFEIYKFESTENFVTKSWIFGGGATKYFPVSDTTFILGNTGRIGLVKFIDPLAGDVLYSDKLVLEPISGFVVIGQLSIVAAWIILMLLGGLTWIVAFIRFLVQGSSKNLRISTIPNMVSVIFLITLLLTIVGWNDSDRFFAQPGILSVSLLLCSIFMVIFTIWSLVSVFRSRNQQANRFTYWHMVVLSCLHLWVTIYLSWFKVIPIMTWT